MLPGTYTVFASTRATNVPLTASGRLDVTNGADGNFTLALRQSVAVPGRLFVNTPPPENYRAETVQITLTPADNVPVASVVARAAPDGTFTLNNVAPGRYRMTVTPQGGAYAERALFAGTDALNEIVQVDSGDAPIQILIGSTEGRIEAVAEQAGTPFPNARVLLAPAARARLDLYRLATTDKNGKVVFSNVAPGAYKLFAWESMARATAYRNSRFLEQFEGNGRVVIVDRMGTVSPGQLPVLPAAQ
jgi:hypothetical protein